MCMHALNYTITELCTDGVRYWSFIAIISIIPWCLLASLLFLLSPYIIPHYMAVEVQLAEKASYFVIISMPSLWTLAISRVVQKYLQAQAIMTPSMICGLIGLIVVFLANLMFIFAADGGYVGCAFGMLFSRLIMLVFLLYYVSTHPSIDVSISVWLVVAGAWGVLNGNPPEHPMFVEHIRKLGLDRDAADKEEDSPLLRLAPGDITNDDARSSKRGRKNKKHSSTPRGHKLSYEKWKHGVLQSMKRFAVLGLPGGIILGLELWCFDIGTILASFIGPVTLSAHKILLLWSVFLYISIPFSLSITASIRISSLLAAQNHNGAALTSRVVILLGFMLSIGFASLTYYLGDYIGYLFSSDQDTINRVALLAPTVAIFQTVNALQPCAQGILRGCGQQGTVVLFNFLSMWVFGFPAGLVLAFYVRPSYGINGLWYGYTLGIGMQTVVLVGMIVGTDWETEVRKARLRIEHLTEGITGSDGTSRDALYEMQIAVPRPGSRALGGFLLSSEMGDEYLDDLERIEITELYDPTQPLRVGPDFSHTL